LHERLGETAPPPDAAFSAVAERVRPSRLPLHRLVETSADVRVLHARGQSLPDWFALRFGRLDLVPDGVAFPESPDDVRDILTYARDCGAIVIPYGGGTSVSGGVTPLREAPVLTVSTARMRRLLDLDRASGLATFGAGVTGPDLEAQLRPHGLTLGHFPQSFEYSTLGGWIATRSCGQQSLHYGRMETLFAGGRIETPAGPLRVPAFPASAAGIDLRELVLGSEGRLGIVTEATMRVRDIAEEESFEGIFFPNWTSARDCVAELAARPDGLSMLRLANPLETLTTLRLAGGRASQLLQRYLALRGARDEKCLLVAAVTGTLEAARFGRDALHAAVRKHGGVSVGRAVGERWRENRFRSVYLRNALWENGYAVDTIETAVDWSRVDAMMHAVEEAARNALSGEPIHGYSHLSHLYPEGSSVYSTFLFRIAPQYDENIARWERFKRAVSEAIVANGGTITHQHGVGLDHKPYIVAEKGALGLDVLRSIFARFDPAGIMNPGKLC
jgi:alkyldihydroxyacetonephosphate synthase